MANKRVKAKKVQAMIDMYNSGLTLKQVTEAFGYHNPDSVRYHFKKAGVVMRDNKARTIFTNDILNKASKLAAKGWTYREIGEELNVNPVSLRTKLAGWNTPEQRRNKLWDRLLSSPNLNPS